MALSSFEIHSRSSSNEGAPLGAAHGLGGSFHCAAGGFEATPSMSVSSPIHGDAWASAAERDPTALQEGVPMRALGADRLSVSGLRAKSSALPPVGKAPPCHWSAGCQRSGRKRYAPREQRRSLGRKRISDTTPPSLVLTEEESILRALLQFFVCTDARRKTCDDAPIHLSYQVLVSSIFSLVTAGLGSSCSSGPPDVARPRSGLATPEVEHSDIPHCKEVATHKSEDVDESDIVVVVDLERERAESLRRRLEAAESAMEVVRLEARGKSLSCLLETLQTDLANKKEERLRASRALEECRSEEQEAMNKLRDTLGDTPCPFPEPLN